MAPASRLVSPETVTSPAKPPSASAPRQQPSPDRLIVALDVPTAAEALRLVDRLDGCCHWVKVGMELYYAAGSSVIRRLRERGLNVFLDLKLHDIPNTVAAAVRSVSAHEVGLLTLHACGGDAMMRAAVDAATPPGAPRLLAVTVLTSMDGETLRSTGVPDSPHAHVLRLAALAKASGIAGLVCSAEEVEAVRALMGPDALLVVPGIRPAGSPSGDQRRIATPADALQRGASIIVVGRPIVQAADPAKAARAILDDIASV